MSENEDQPSPDTVDDADVDASTPDEAEPEEAPPAEEPESEAAEPQQSQSEATEAEPSQSEASALLERLREADEELAEMVESHVEALEAERDDLREQLEAREAELDERTSQLKRAQADFQNYKKRAKKRQQQIQDRATEDLVTRLLDVRDNLKRALSAEGNDAESLREGIEMTLREFDHVLEGENVTEIDPEPGTDVDPQRHEVMMRVEDDHPEDTVSSVYRPGYEMAGKVIQAAQVTVSDGSGAQEDPADDGAETGDRAETGGGAGTDADSA